MAARALDKKILLTTSEHPLVQIQKLNMFLLMPSTKIAQTVQLHQTKGSPKLF